MRIAWLSFLDELIKIAGKVSTPTVKGAPKPPTVRSGKGVIKTQKPPSGMAKKPYVPKPPIVKRKMAAAGGPVAKKAPAVLLQVPTPPKVKALKKTASKPSLLGPNAPGSKSDNLTPITPRSNAAKAEQAPGKWHTASAGKEGHSQDWKQSVSPRKPRLSGYAGPVPTDTRIVVTPPNPFAPESITPTARGLRAVTHRLKAVKAPAEPSLMSESRRKLTPGYGGNG